MTGATSTRRDQLTRAALELLEEVGPEALSTRKVAARFGASTMAVYSEFGSLGGLVTSVVKLGFGILADELRAVPATDDPVADIAGIAEAYRAFAHAHPHLYRVIYAVQQAGGHERTGAELLTGREAFTPGLEAIRRGFEAGRLSRGTAYDAALQLWTGLHGIVVIELSGYLEAIRPPDSPLVSSFVTTLCVGLGDAPARAEASVGAVRR